jgi:hypothetical protein
MSWFNFLLFQSTVLLRVIFTCSSHHDLSSPYDYCLLKSSTIMPILISSIVLNSRHLLWQNVKTLNKRNLGKINIKPFCSVPKRVCTLISTSGAIPNTVACHALLSYFWIMDSNCKDGSALDDVTRHVTLAANEHDTDIGTWLWWR